MATVYTVTASTSVVLINTLQTPNTVVLLSSVVNPGHIVGIRDTTGSPLIASRPIVISTTNGIRFYDGSFSTLLTQPNTSLIVSSRNRTTWQVLNNQAFFTSISSVTLNTLTATYGTVRTLSSAYDVVSTLIVRDITIRNTFALLGDDYHFRTLDVLGRAVFSSITLNTALFSTTLTVTGDVYAASSFQLKDSLTVQCNVNVQSDIFVGQNLYISSALILQQGALLPKNLSVQTLDIQSATVGGFAQVAGTVTVSTLAIGQSLITLSSLTTQGTLSTGSLTASNLTVRGTVQASTLSIVGTASVQKDTTIGSHTRFFNTLSSAGTLTTTSSIVSELSTIVGTVYSSNLTATTAIVQGQAFLSSLTIGSTLGVGGNMALTTDALFNTISIQGKLGVGSNLSVLGNTGVLASLSTQGNLYVGENLFIQGYFSTLSSVLLNNIWGVSSMTVANSVSTAALHVKNTLYVQGTMSIMGNFLAASLSSPYTVRSVSTLIVSTQITTQNAYIAYLTTSTLTTPTSIYINTDTLPAYNLAVTGNSYFPGVQALSVVGSAVQASSLQFTGSFVLGSTTTVSLPSIATPARFQSTLFSDSIGANTVYSSTATANYFIGDAYNVSNLVNYRPNQTISLMTLSTLYTTDMKSQAATTANAAVIGNSLDIKTVSFITSISLLLACGSDFSNVDVKTSYQNGPWTASSSGLFDGVATSMVTNQNPNDPIFVAVGQSSNAVKTIQWSIDGSNWNYILTGGFILGGNDVAYSPSLGLFVAVGKGNVNIQYSGDGKNWSNGTNPFTDFGYTGVEPYNRIKWGTSEFLAIRTSPAYGSKPVTYEIKYSTDGINWTNVTSQTSNTTTNAVSLLGMNTFGFGFSNYWYIIDTQKRINYLTTLGASYWSWSLSVPLVPYAASFLNSIWLIGCSNAILTSTDLTSGVYNTYSVNSIIDTFAYDTVYSRYIAGGTSINPLNTIYTSSNSSVWIPLTSGGYYSGTAAYGVGYGIFNAPNFKGLYQSTTSYFFGSGSIDGLAPIQPMIFVNNDVNQYSTIYTITGLFSNVIRGIGYNPAASNYKVVAVGDGPTPLKTIGVYRDLYSMGSNISTNSLQFTQALTGGFSTVGYGVTYYTRSSLWLAVGQHNLSANTIQYSKEGLIWKSLNNSQYVRQAATSITWGEFQGTTNILITGADPLSNRCIAVGDDSFAWRGTGGFTGFSGYRGNAGAMAQDLAFVVGARNSNGITPITETIKYTKNMDTFNNVRTGGFSNAGYGVAVKYPIYPYVIGGTTTGYNDTIRYSSDGITWSNAYNGLPSATLSITYSKDMGIYVAAGGSGTKTMAYSKDGKNWSYGYGGNTKQANYVTATKDPMNIPCFWAVGADSTTPYDKARISYDGIYWSTITHPLQNQNRDGNGRLKTDPLYNPNFVITAGVFGMCKIGSVYTVSGFGVYANYPYTQGIGSPTDIVYSYDLINWTNASGSFSTDLGFGLALGYDDTLTPMVVAAGGAFGNNNGRTAYSYDGINWTACTGPATNYGVRSVGYGGGKWVLGGPIVSGKTIFYSGNGKNFSNITSGGFTTGIPQSQNCLSYNSASGIWTIVGQDTGGKTVKYSGDAVNWSNCTGRLVGDATNLTVGYSTWSANVVVPPLSTIIVAVGDPGSSNSPNSIQYSYDGSNFSPANSAYAYIKGIGYGVTYNPALSTFFAVGQDSLGTASTTILRSVDGAIWSTNTLASFSDPAVYEYQKGFASQQLTGTTRRVAFQYLNIPQNYPFIQTSNFVLFEHYQANNSYSTNTVRYVSSFMTINETLAFNLSSQMMINTNIPYQDALMTVNGTVYASSISFTGNQNQVGQVFYTSTLTVSTLVLQSSLITTGVLSTPTLTILQSNGPVRTANRIISYSGKGIQLNSLFVSPSSVGINTMTPQASLQVAGTTGALSTSIGTYFTSLSTVVVTTPPTNTMLTLNDSFGILSQSRGDYSTSMITTATSLSFNNLIYFTSVSSVGIATSSPAFSLDVKYPVNTYSVLSSPNVYVQVLRPSVVYL